MKVCIIIKYTSGSFGDRIEILKVYKDKNEAENYIKNNPHMDLELIEKEVI